VNYYVQTKVSSCN